MSQYHVGDRVRLAAAFADTAGAAADPTTVTLQVQRVGSPIETYTYPATVQKAATGSYYYDYDVTREGIHEFRWVATGTVVAAEEGHFTVPESSFV